MFLTGAGYIDVTGWFLSRIRGCGLEQVITIPFLLEIITATTTIPNSIFRFNSKFLLLINLSNL